MRNATQPTPDVAEPRRRWIEPGAVAATGIALAALITAAAIATPAPTSPDTSARLIPSATTAPTAAPATAATVDALPVAVRDAIARHAVDGRLREVEHDLHRGALVYEVKFEANGARGSTTFAADGGVVEEALEIDLAAVPDAVQQAVRAAHPDAKIDDDDIERIKASGRVVYTLSIDGKGTAERDLVVASDGAILIDQADANDDDD